MHAVRRFGLALALLFVMLLITSVSTASPSAKLVFARGADTDACPEEQGFRAAVAARVGYDPFFPFAKRTVVTRIDTVAGGRFRARMEVLDDKGSLVGEKSFVSAGRDCEELVRTLALAVSLAIDVADPPPAPEPTPEPPAEPPPPAAMPELVAPEPPAERPRPRADEALTRVRVELSATARGSIGIAPSTSLGLGLGAALRRGAWSIELEGRYDPPATDAVTPSTRLSIGLIAGSLVPCGRWRALFVCGLVAVGQLSAASSGIHNPASDDALFVAAGARVGAEVEASRLLAFRASLDVAAAPITHPMNVAGREVYETSSVFGSLGGSAVVRF